MRCALFLALCSVLLAGCRTRGDKSAVAPGRADGASQTGQPSRTLPGPVQVVGRIIAVDLRSLAVVIELAPYAVASNLDKSILVSRTDDLRPTARLQGSPYLRGRTLGARLLAGQPQIGNEVVIVPAAP